MHQLEASVAELDHVLLCMSSAWDGDGFYEIEGRHRGFPPNIHHVTRRFCEVLGGWNLWGAYYWDGYLIAPRDIIEPYRIVRKVEDPELKMPRAR
jgi:hypothetical protein